LQLNEVLTRVIDGMQDLIYLGYPVPERIEGKMPGFVSLLLPVAGSPAAVVALEVV